MKDLKYLYEFEKLLESANNPLVQQACAEGKHALAYTCYHMPEVLLNTGDCFSVRLRAPLTGSLDISSYYMSNFICDYCKSLLERGIEKTFGSMDKKEQLAAVGAIIDELDLRRPIYRKTAAYGHFGRELPEFTWERTDRAEDLRKTCRLA